MIFTALTPIFVVCDYFGLYPASIFGSNPASILREVERILERVQLSAQTVKVYRSVLERVFDIETSERTNEIRRIEAEIAKTEARKRHIQAQFADNHIPASDYLELKLSIDNDLYHQKKSLEELKTAEAPFKEYSTPSANVGESGNLLPAITRQDQKEDTW